MSYSVNINQGNNTVSIPARKALAGYTLKLVLDRGGSSAPVEITSGLTVSGQSVVASVAGRLSDYSGSDYTLMGTKNGSTEVLQNGHIYKASQQAMAGADDVNVVNSPSVTVANPVTSVGITGTVPVTGTVSTVPPVGGTLVGTIQSKIREDFPGSAIDANMWDVAIGAGMGVAVSGSNLNITAGTTANAVTTIRSKRSWTGAYRVMFIGANTLLSNRIANSEVQLRVTNAAGTSYSAWVFNGTTNTTGIVRAYNNGNTTTDQTQAGIPSTGGAGVFEIENFIDEVYFHTRLPESTNARATSNVKNRNTPDPNEEMFVEIRITNGVTAPASSITLALDAILIQDISELTTEITGGRGAGSASQAIPVVQMATGATTNVNIANTPGFGLASIPALDTPVSTTAQAANATMTGTTIDGGTTVSGRSNRAWIEYSATAAALGSIAHLIMQESLDGTTWREVWRTPVPADAAIHSFEVPVRQRYRRWLVANGPTAQTALFVFEHAVVTNGAVEISKNLSIPLTPAAGSALAVSAQYVGPTLDLGANHMWDKIRLLVSSDQTGNQFIQQSFDGSTWFVTTQSGSQTIGANNATATITEAQICARYLRARIDNSTTAATTLRVVADLVSL